MKAKKRLPQTRLTDEDVRGIQYAWRVDKMPQVEIAKTYGVSQPYVSMILRRLRRQKV
jgi:DNA-binding MarR family transcriptional regulator